MVALAQQVCARLIGYSDTSPEAILESLDLPDDVYPLDNDSFLDEFDRLCFCCTGCEQWFAQIDNANPGYDHAKPWICKECAREETA
jgi:hypothetical protein